MKIFNMNDEKETKIDVEEICLFNKSEITQIRNSEFYIDILFKNGRIITIKYTNEKERDKVYKVLFTYMIEEDNKNRV